MAEPAHRSDFRKLWAGQAVSAAGSAVTRSALPLTAVLVLGASPLQMGLLGAAGTVPVLVAGLPAGLWADRLRHRPILIAADLGRALLLATIPLAAALGVLGIGQFYLVAALAGILTVFFDVTYRSYLPALVPRTDLLAANSRLAASEAVAELSGTALAGVLVQAITGPVTLLLDALSFVWSACWLGLIRTSEDLPPAPAHRDARREVLAGLHTVLEQPVLRAPALALLLVSLFGNLIGATYFLYALHTLHLSPALVGLVIAAGGLGSFPGALLAATLGRRCGLGRVLIGALLLGGALNLLIPLARGPILLAAGMLIVNQFWGDLVRTVYLVNDVSLRQAVAPIALLGRVNGSVHVLTEGAAPLGLVLGGVLAELLGIRPTLYIAAAGSVPAALCLALSPVRGLWQLPAGAPAPAA